jgi:putative intracellular protease/amidase
MKRLLMLLLVLIAFISCNKSEPKVLLFIRAHSVMPGYMLKNEVSVMKDLLEKAGYKVITASLSGEIIKNDTMTLKPDLRLSEVKTGDYKGFIFPCMASGDTVPPAAVVEFVKKVNAEGKPIAAQLSSVLILAKAGLMDGKKYAFMDNSSEIYKMFPYLSKGIFSGTGVVTDGKIITSGICPGHAKMTGLTDGTTQLTQALIGAMGGPISK